MIYSKNKVMIIEDSSPDRFRFRSILDMMGKTFCFAWEAKGQRIPRVKKVFKLMEEFKPDFLIVDLAWEKEDDILLNELIFCDSQEINLKKDLVQKGKHPANIKKWISGFRLLEKLASHTWEQEKKIFIIITTQYIPPAAFGLKEYIHTNFKNANILQVIHKWRDEQNLINILS